MEKILISEEEELKELVSHIHKNNQIRFFIFSIFLLLELLLKWGNVGIPGIIIGISALLLFLTVLCQYLLKKIQPKHTVTQVSLGYLIVQIIEVICLLAGIHFFGAVPLGGMTVLMVYIMFCYLGFTRRIYPRIVALTSIIGYTILALLEHLRILEYHDVRNLGVNLMRNWGDFFVNITFMVGFSICLALYADIFSKKLRDSIGVLRIKTSQLTKKEKELNEEKATLEIKIEARTKELKELAESLDTQVKQRTKELQEKIGELERFQRLAVGRELKMIELKKEIERLKKELGENKSRS